MKFSAKSDKGLIRKINQDSFGYYVNDTGVCFFIVADGMGGHNAGEVASAIAVDTFTSEARALALQNGTETVPNFIKNTLKKTNDLILYRADAEKELIGMGTTAVTAIVKDGKLIIGNIGDSRAYILSGESIEQLTVDHSYVELLLKAGSIDMEEAKIHPRRNEITRALGVRSYSEPDIFVMDYQEGDILILCSDGLNKMVNDAQIRDIASKSSDTDDICARLIDAAKENGGEDNITVIAAVL